MERELYEEEMMMQNIHIEQTIVVRLSKNRDNLERQIVEVSRNSS